MDGLTAQEQRLIDLLSDGAVHPLSAICSHLDVDPNTFHQHVFRTRTKIARNYDIIFFKRRGLKGYRLVRLVASSNE